MNGNLIDSLWNSRYARINSTLQRRGQWEPVDNEEVVGSEDGAVEPVANAVAAGTTSNLRKVLVLVGVLVLIPVVAIGTLALTSGSADGPSAFFGGGELVAGELVTGAEPDWSFVGDVGTIELQLLDPLRSRLIWVADYEGKLYVVSGYMTNPIGRLWKRWPAQAERDGRAVVRIEGKRYERTLVRILSGADILQGVSEELGRKYGFGGPGGIESGNVWLFELAPRGMGTTGASR